MRSIGGAAVEVLQEEDGDWRQGCVVAMLAVGVGTVQAAASLEEARLWGHPEGCCKEATNKTKNYT